MTGLDRILSQIGYEAQTAADTVLAEAKRQAEVIAKEAEAEGRAQAQHIEQQSAAAVQDALARAESAAQLQKKKAVLAVKQELIAQALENAHKALCQKTGAEYFEVILKMAKKFSLPQPGEILFNERDLAALPAGFEATLNAAVKEQGAVLKISKETRPIDGGFVLSYGGVEENCSFAALFDSAREALQDKVHELLFS